MIKRNQRGISPVAGIIILLGISTVLASSVGAFALGLTDFNTNSPDVNLGLEYNSKTGEASVIHNGGQQLELPRENVDNKLEVKVNGKIPDENVENAPWSGEDTTGGESFGGFYAGEFADGNIPVTSANIGEELSQNSGNEHFSLGNGLMVNKLDYEEGDTIKVVWNPSGTVLLDETIEESSDVSVTGGSTENEENGKDESDGENEEDESDEENEENELENSTEEAPNTMLEFQYEEDTSELTIVHTGGEEIKLPHEEIENPWEVRINGMVADEDTGNMTPLPITHNNPNRGGEEWGGLYAGGFSKDTPGKGKQAPETDVSTDGEWSVGDTLGGDESGVMVDSSSYSKGDKIKVVWNLGENNVVMAQTTINSDSANDNTVIKTEVKP